MTAQTAQMSWIAGAKSVPNRHPSTFPSGVKLVEPVLVSGRHATGTMIVLTVQMRKIARAKSVPFPAILGVKVVEPASVDGIRVMVSMIVLTVQMRRIARVESVPIQANSSAKVAEHVSLNIKYVTVMQTVQTVQMKKIAGAKSVPNGHPLTFTFRCESNGACVPEWDTCNGIDDCPDGSDEKDCLGGQCPISGDFRCESSGACVSERNTCNGIDDCPDGSDEKDCSGGECPNPGEFKCESVKVTEPVSLNGIHVTVSMTVLTDQMRRIAWADSVPFPAILDAKVVEPVSPEWDTCNGIDDCPDGSDEKDCSGGECPNPGEFKCESSGTCFPEYQICNGDADCADGSDEEDCWSKECPQVPGFQVNYLRCESSGVCVPEDLICNGDADCPDGSDERDCSGEVCPIPGDFRCESSGACVREWDTCNGIDDCPDGSDEKDCSGGECPIPGEFKCESSGTCFPEYQICNGDADCADGSDEEDCWSKECPQVPGFQVNYLRCESSGVCVPEDLICNGDADCADGTDEDDCWSRECPQLSSFERYERVLTGALSVRRLNLSMSCSGVEVAEPVSYHRKCVTAVMTAQTAQMKKIAGAKSVLSRHPSTFPSDEEDCWNKECPQLLPADELFRCESSGACVTPSQMCNGVNDCADGSDEGCWNEDCPYADFFKCAGGGKTCVHPQKRCDGFTDCQDGSDENCVVTECPINDFVCKNYEACVNREQQCDGHEDCSDGSDEDECWDKECPLSDSFKCKSSGKCVNETTNRCDGVVDCHREGVHDESDESGCGKLTFQ
uniref:Uncharacterized protein n=1 Tax=Branchiostoma floridae TaxID=7739 RepID=C3ZFK3_BRAFL|eukprot:XP_002592746.1 hypothetical protein BRAFLDRAFT_67186 [Branchiostoma floridae]